jgi:hypothetical protein
MPAQRAKETCQRNAHQRRFRVRRTFYLSDGHSKSCLPRTWFVETSIDQLDLRLELFFGHICICSNSLCRSFRAFEEEAYNEYRRNADALRGVSKWTECVVAVTR